MHMSLVYIYIIYMSSTFLGPLVGGFNPFQRYKLSGVLSNQSPKNHSPPGNPRNTISRFGADIARHVEVQLEFDLHNHDQDYSTAMCKS